MDVKALHDDWTRFANLAGSRELPKLEKAGVQFRLPVPGARINNGVLRMNNSLPGVAMEYSTDGGARWQRYDDAKPPRVTGAVQVRSVSSDGKRYSRVDNVQP